MSRTVGEIMIREIDVFTLKRLLEDGQQPILVDVREDFEWRRAALPGAVHIPLGELGSRFDELDASRPTVVYCHHGIRSLSGAWVLSRAGFGEVVSLAGGIDAWSRQVDPNVPRY